MLPSQIIFIAGTLPFILLGAMHAIIAIKDISRPRAFTPVNGQVRTMMEETPMRFTDKTTMWKAWLGFNISHGLGVAVFGLLLLIIAVKEHEWIRWLAPLAIAIGALYLWLSLRFWFNKPTIGIMISLSLWSMAWLLEMIFN